MTVRMPAELNADLIKHCDTIPAPANTYINGLLESALALRDPSSAILKRQGDRGGPKVIVTIRMEPQLQQRLAAHCAEFRLSANGFVCGLIAKDLRRRSRVAEA
jgi:hypothetical protein